MWTLSEFVKACDSPHLPDQNHQVDMMSHDLVEILNLIRDMRGPGVVDDIPASDMSSCAHIVRQSLMRLRLAKAKGAECRF